MNNYTQTKPARRLGSDITQSTLQTTLDQAGIDKKIADLSYAEKRLVIIASLLQQVEEANGDWGRTIESVANQTRIMSEQWERLTRAFGNMLLPIVKQILPYVNGILMALTEIFNVIAALLGYDEEDYDFFGKTNKSAVDLSNNIDNATDSTEKLKKSMLGIRSFDKIINISTPKDSKSDSGSSLGISADIMKLANTAMDDYNKKLDNVQMKATKIRDNIMEWLGFTKQVDEKTGKVSWKFDHITGGTVLGALIAGGVIFNGIKKIMKMINFFTGNSLLKINKQHNSWLKIIGKLAIGYGALADGWNRQKGIFSVGTAEMLVGIASLMSGFQDLGKKIKGLGEYGGPIGMLVGSFTGLVITVQKGFAEIDKAYKSTTEKGKKYSEQLKNANKDILESVETDILRLETAQKYIERLSEFLDEDGKVKEGYSFAAQNYLDKINEAYGTEYKLKEGIITLNGKMVKGVEAIKESTKKLIAQKKIEMVLKAYEEQYIKNLKTQQDLLKEQESYQNRINANQQNYEEALKRGDIYAAARHAASIKRLKEGKRSIEDALADIESDIINYDNLLTGSIEGNQEKIYNSMKYYGIELEKDQINQLDNVKKRSEKVVSEIKNKFSSAEFKINFSADVSRVKTVLSTMFDKLPYPAKAIIEPISKALSKVKISGFANGGLPSVGQLFVANESGPELVGSIGGQSFVANQQQLGNFIERKNQQTQKSSGNQVFNIYLDKNKKLATYTLNELQSMAKANGSPIEIS